jgi:hypothetical protein
VPGMPDYDAAAVDRLAQVILFTEWRRLIGAGWVSRGLLLDWRHRLAGNEFMPGPLRELMALEVADALAGMMGCDPADLPGAPLVPDSPEDLGGLPPGPGPV